MVRQQTLIFQNSRDSKSFYKKGEFTFASFRRGFTKAASFVFSVSVVLCSLVLIQGCTLEDETEDKIVVPLKDTSTVHDNPLTLKFLDLTKKCTTGDIDTAPDVLSMYLSSLPAEDVPDNAKSYYRGLLENKYLFQRKDLNLEFEKCLQKVAVTGLKEYRAFYLTRATVAARISQYYYAHEDYENGAYWCLRVINLLGIDKGYNILGRVFVKDPKTVNIGAQMLSESAKHDNVNASVFLSDSVLFRNVFDIVSEEESKNENLQESMKANTTDIVPDNQTESSDKTENYLKK